MLFAAGEVEQCKDAEGVPSQHLDDSVAHVTRKEDRQEHGVGASSLAPLGSTPSRLQLEVNSEVT